ncbi:hypothetical protein LZC95_29655 [Pendulispora brunnea]|uniref:Uncharacterized protein n=1 Tax=Pendulispora brunnea TaxID=2905690 RepID=A0ABZ2K1I6_9BACT
MKPFGLCAREIGPTKTCIEAGSGDLPIVSNVSSQWIVAGAGQKQAPAVHVPLMHVVPGAHALDPDGVLGQGWPAAAMGVQAAVSVYTPPWSKAAGHTLSMQWTCSPPKLPFLRLTGGCVEFSLQPVAIRNVLANAVDKKIR